VASWPLAARSIARRASLQAAVIRLQPPFAAHAPARRPVAARMAFHARKRRRIRHMQQTMNQGTGSTGVTDSPVDDATYNLLQALVSKLEAIEAYQMYAEDDTDGIFEELLQEERQHAQRLHQALSRKMGGR
jgi:hypothetical protein